MSLKSRIVHAPHLVPKPMGLGDAVEVVAKPVARAIDAVTSILPASMQTHITTCTPCGNRRDALNAAMPDIKHPFK